MDKKNVQPYIILAFSLLVIFSAPKKTQNILRNQFIKPLVPLAHLISKSKQIDSPTKHIPLPKSSYEQTFPNSTVAKIIYRNPTNWNDYFWIQLNEKTRSKVSLNSPVLYQNTLIGVIDYAGKNEARVKMITSSNLTVSVRAVRGQSQYCDLMNHLNTLLSYQCVDQNLDLKEALLKLKEKTSFLPQNLFLAKGELFGSSQPLWRSGNKILYGKGFNASFEDNLSLARDLVSGKPFNNESATVIIQPDDLLITTGLDGVFPEGLIVGRVLTVDPLEEGAYYYSLKASPIMTDLDQIHFVEIIDPVATHSNFFYDSYRN